MVSRTFEKKSPVNCCRLRAMKLTDFPYGSEASTDRHVTENQLSVTSTYKHLIDKGEVVPMPLFTEHHAMKAYWGLKV
jgi:hypothetical protein